MVALLLHDQNKYPIKGSQPLEINLGNRIILTEQERIQVSTLIAAEIARIETYDQIDWEALDQTNLVEKRAQFEATNALMERELSRCSKIEKALEVMYKMYFARDASNKQKLRELN